MYYTYFEDTCYFYSNFLLNVKVAKSWNRLMHGAGVSYVGLL